MSLHMSSVFGEDLSRQSSVLPTKSMLEDWSFTASIGKSTNKLTVTDDIVRIVEVDSKSYETALKSNDDIERYSYRVKSPDSIRLKAQRYPDLRFQSTFNDVLGIRIYSDHYLTSVPDYLRLVDLTKGKSVDDGYRAQHLYFKRDNNSYIIEIQIWAGADINFNVWSHELTYKSVQDPSIMQRVRKLYDKGMIKDAAQFRNEVLRLWQQR